jgi:hypothetical protein
LAAVLTVIPLAFTSVALFLIAVEIANGWSQIDQSGVTQTMVAAIALCLTFPLVGWTILRHDPSNRLGWVYLAIGFFESLNVMASGYVIIAFRTGMGDAPLAVVLSWIAIWAWVPGFTLFATLGILLFPDGRLPTRRWWPVVALAAVALVLSLVPALASWPYRGLPLEQAIALNAAPPSDPTIEFAFNVEAVGQLVLLAAMIGSVAGMAVRFRRSVGVERQQLKWFTYGALLTVVILVIWTAGFLSDPVGGAVSGLLVGAILPLATAAAILRYRLYDIDRLVSRTIGYAALSGILGFVFVALVLLSQAVVAAVLPEVSRSGTPAIAASTLIVAALFQPVRRRVQAVVDNRFDRAGVDRDAAVTSLGNRLRDAVELEAIRLDVLGTVDATIRPSNATLWLRRG